MGNGKSSLFERLNDRGYHLETDVGYYMSGRRMGPAEREEEFRAQMIDAEIAERRKQERRNHKGY